MALTRRDLLAASAFAALAPPAAAQETPVQGGTLTAVMYPEPPYLLSAVDPTLQMAVVTTKMQEGLLWYDLDMNPHPLWPSGGRWRPTVSAGRSISGRA